MRERINRLARGIIDDVKPQLVTEPTIIKESIGADETRRIEIQVSSKNKTNVKGLAYSSNPRLSIITSSFGGSKNRIICEIDSRFLDKGDRISGVVHLVTNGGKQDIPYEFNIELDSSQRVLNKVKTVEDIALIAKEDEETALRLFEYTDFKNIACMQDAKIASLYEAFSGRSNKARALEEFLVACHAKEPVRINVPEREFTYEDIKSELEITIPIRKSTWGYLEISIKPSSDCLRIDKHTITDKDFTGDQYELKVHADPNRLHIGKNIVSINISTVRGTLSVNIYLTAAETVDESYTKDRYIYHKKYFAAYARYRLEYEYDIQNRKALAANIEKTLDRLSTWTEKKNLVAVLKAELMLTLGDSKKALEYVGMVRDDIKLYRQEQLYEYFLLEYIYAVLEDNKEKKDSYIRLVKKFMAEERMHSLFPLLIKLEPTYIKNPASLFNLITEEYALGNRNPYMYLTYINMLNSHPELLHDIDNLEAACLIFGMRYKLIGSELSKAVAGRAAMIKKYSIKNVMLLTKLYESFQSEELVTAICSLLIKGDERDKKVYSWYKKGVDSKCDIIGIYNYLIYTMPDNLDELLPKSVLEFFVDKTESLDVSSRAKLYENIILYLDRDTFLYREYTKLIRGFAISQAKLGYMDSHMATIYDRIITKSDIDEELSKKLPDIINTYCIECNVDNIKYINVAYPELSSVDIYTINSGRAYIPIYTEDATILFQDAYSNRYYDIPFRKKEILNKRELIEACYDIYPEHIMLRLGRVKQALKAGIESLTEAGVVERAIAKLPLSDTFRQQAVSALIQFYKDKPNDIKPDFLLMTDKRTVSGIERVDICEALIDAGCYKQAYEMLKDYGCLNISDTSLESLCSRIILEKMFEHDKLLLYLAYKSVRAGSRSKVLIDYLCEYFNGSTEDMIFLFDIACAENTEMYDLDERLLAQMLFTDEYNHIDKVFAHYLSGRKKSESMIRAYLTIKSSRYFLNNISASDEIFDYLEKLYAGTPQESNIPAIYKLALIRHYASCDMLSDESSKIASSIVNGLIEDGIVFPFYKKLSKHIHIPSDIMEKCIIVYRPKSGTKPLLRMRIAPEQEDFYEEEMRRMIFDIYIKEQVLFSGETLEYKLYDAGDYSELPSKEGSIKGNGMAAVKGSRFDYLNNMSSYLRDSEMDKLQDTMREYITKAETAKALFDIK